MSSVIAWVALAAMSVLLIAALASAAVGWWRFKTRKDRL